MLKSSMKYTRRFVPGGPYIEPVFFSSGCSSMNCKVLASEYELKLIVKNSVVSDSRFASLSMMIVVFADPAVPTSIAGFFWSARASRTNVSRVVSIVGTTIDEKDCASAPTCVYGATASFQFTHFFDSPST